MLKKFQEHVAGMLFTIMLVVSGGLFSIYILDIANAAVGNTGTPPSPVTDASSLVALLCNVIYWMVFILLAVAVIMIVMAAFQYVTAGDDTEKTSKARKTLTYAAIGIAVALMAYGFPQIVSTVFPSNPDVTSFTCNGSGTTNTDNNTPPPGYS
jgi:heme/copper-type cytochrome/quinol oxidase subunit 2